MYKTTFFTPTRRWVLPSRTNYLHALDYTDTLTKEMAEFSYDRMELHRKFVLNNIHYLLEQKDLKQNLALSEEEFIQFKRELIERGVQHDLSKFSEPEIVPYIYINWKHHSEKKLKKSYSYPSEIKPKVKEAITHHFQNNPHHYDYYCFKADNTREDNVEKIKELLKNMSDVDLVEMVADWMAVSQEQKTNCTEYAMKTVGEGKLKPFSEAQQTKIFKLISLLEPTQQANIDPPLSQKVSVIRLANYY